MTKEQMTAILTELGAPLDLIAAFAEEGGIVTIAPTSTPDVHARAYLHRREDNSMRSLLIVERPSEHGGTLYSTHVRAETTP